MSSAQRSPRLPSPTKSFEEIRREAEEKAAAPRRRQAEWNARQRAVNGGPQIPVRTPEEIAERDRKALLDAELKRATTKAWNARRREAMRNYAATIVTTMAQVGGGRES